ncbi:MAG: Cof-type HAD-IIB family hydrolase [Acholeplasmataceae bacterium]|nr:Cof-type HAD-IIB family hydrolase [Acholeplasmataceae bacterium]
MKLVVADLDGTLIHSKGFSKETLKTVKKLQEQGIIFTIATGRHIITAKDYVKELHVKYPVIYSNGAYIYDHENKKVIHEALIDKLTALKTMKVCSKYNLDFIIYTVDNIYATKKSRDKLVSKVGKYDLEVVSEEELKSCVGNGVIKILVFDDDVERIIEARNILSQIKDIYPIQSSRSYIDIGHHSVNKGNALTILAKHLNVSLENCMAIGDQENDLQMIQVAGVGVAMGDGNVLLKDEADYITKSFEENGFSYAVEKYFFG